MIVAIAGEILRMPGLPKSLRRNTSTLLTVTLRPQLIPVRQQQNWLRATTKLVVRSQFLSVHGLINFPCQLQHTHFAQSNRGNFAE